mmetsp:Transcript_88760/g.275708  ORF Transcript_88760/g.275708 Transcript_88760/m.275708 type:complete len:311 (+) Transcript_88760:1344-2276(+)
MMLAQSCSRCVSQKANCVQKALFSPSKHGRRSSMRMLRHQPPRQSRTRYTPAELRRSCEGSRARTKQPPWNSARAASEEMSQQSPSSPCCTSSACGAPRKSCQSPRGSMPKSSQAKPPRGRPACAVTSCGRHHLCTLPSWWGLNSGSTNSSPLALHWNSTERSSFSSWSSSTEEPPPRADFCAAGPAAARATTRCGVGRSPKPCGAPLLDAFRSISWRCGGSTHFIAVPPLKTTRTEPAGSTCPPWTTWSFGRTSLTTPSVIHLFVELLQTCTASPSAMPRATGGPALPPSALESSPAPCSSQWMRSLAP